MAEPVEAVVDYAGMADVRSDEVLIEAVRGGDLAAYGVLYERHRQAAQRVAGVWVASPTEREDVVAEAFTRVLRALRSGGGPDRLFRPYLFTTMRNTAIGWRRRDSAVSVVADMTEASDDRVDAVTDTGLDATMAVDAFVSLPERWRIVLWYTEIEGQAPAKVAPLLGMKPNGVAALAYRAREGLRRAYLDQHLPTVKARACRTVVDQLGLWARHKCTPRTTKRINAHLDRCAGCLELATRVTEVNRSLPAILPFVLGIPLTATSEVAPWTTLVAALTGSTAASEAVLAGTGGVGLPTMSLPTASTVSWLATVKNVIASAAIVTTTTITPSAPVVSVPLPRPNTGGSTVVVSTPPDHGLVSPIHERGIPAERDSDSATEAPTPPPVSSPPANATPAGTAPMEPAVEPSAANPPNLPSEQGKADVKLPYKTAKDEGKQAAKTTKKADQETRQEKKKEKETQGDIDTEGENKEFKTSKKESGVPSGR